MRLHHPFVNARGFSLVEVMVAVVIICVGMLGIAKMQAVSLSSTTTSRQRALAAMQAASIASAMHSNRQYWAGTFVAAANPSVFISGRPGAVVSTDAALKAQATTLLANPTAINLCIAGAAGAAVPCTNTQLAAFDLTRWWVNSINNMLPNAQATITCTPPPAGNPAPVACQVLLTWTERAVAVNAQSQAAAATFETPSYLLYVEP